MATPKHAMIELTHSVDDNGYYAEICDTEGKTIHITNLYQSRKTAEKQAKEWAKLNNYTVVLVSHLN